MKIIIKLILVLFITTSYSQSQAIKEFSIENQKFFGSKLSQAEYLLHKVKPMGILDKNDPELPQFITMLMNDPIEVLSIGEIDMYLQDNDMDYSNIGGSIQDSLSRNKKGTSAKYFVIHDTSTPNFKNKDFPKNINDDTWEQNDVEVRWKYKKGEIRKGPHAFIGRTGKIFFPIDFSVPWRATGFENKVLDKAISRGLFIHIELVQPRKSKEGKWKDNDVVSPDPGFTQEQYDKLALLYICASARSGNWLIPAYHAVLDQGFKNGHDDPQNFELNEFSDSIEALVKELKN
ncbi:peptidoglycan recognition protein family protein [Winogradskyella forsetii]|uniref:peptidoglycan recognition protein family protein n=1 Tax=Winogradskyella forsetii TaxID=2686077 RepID=UPI0015BF6FF1|nr:N-acetylmuramoyl-L-alanine amidase [Winogradskyella forsetii]